MHKQKQAFTLVELIVSITIIAILASIWFYSYVWYLSEARDAERKANLWEIKTALKLYKQKRWSVPVPWNYFNIINNWNIVALQWKLDENVTLSTMENIPLDPYTWNNYFYSVTKNKQESQISLTLENWEFPIALLEWDYKTVSKNVLPSIVLATWATVASNVEIHDWVWNWTANRNLFILNWGTNLPYTMKSPNEPFYAWEIVDDVLIAWNITFWQNSDYRNCTEIEEAAKLIHDTGTEEYQILDTTWTLTNTWCVLP
jgi:prepilin-type N-terminal cleavage/methylation domain-containing protein